jgi:hypothetical protein
MFIDHIRGESNITMEQISDRDIESNNENPLSQKCIQMAF